MRQVVLALGLVFALACGQDAPPQAPAVQPALPRPDESARLNVLLITLDTVRADALGAYGQERPTTPNLDAAAANGVLFERAYTSSPSTLPAHATILTGKQPYVHGVRSNAGHVLANAHQTLAEVFRANGYVTGAEIAAPVIGRRTRLDQGFEQYRDLDSFEVRRKRIGVRAADGAETLRVQLDERPAGDVTAQGLAFLRRHASEPFFLWLHYFDAHAPYSPPAPFQHRFSDSPYHGEVHYVDYEVGMVLSHLRTSRLASRTLVVIVADHGEGLGEHGEARHSYFVYDATMRVPLILWGAGGLAEGRRVEQPVRSVDIAPTLLDFAGLPALSGAQGRSLRSIATGGGPMPETRVYGESLEPLAMFGSSALRFLRDGRWKYVHKLEPELYDLGADPAESDNQIGAQAERAERMRTDLIALVEREAASAPGPRVPLDTRLRDQLAALGYVAAETPDSFDDRRDLRELRGPDPTASLPDMQRYTAGWAELRAGSPERAGAVFRDLWERNPGSVPVLRALIAAELRTGRDEASLPLLRRALEIDENHVEHYHALAANLRRRGELAEAERTLRASLALDSCERTGVVLLADLLNAQARYREQRDLLAERIAECEQDADFRNDYAYLLASCPDAALRNGHAALRIARRVVLEHEGDRPDYLDTLASAYAETGNFARAVEIQRRAVRLLRNRRSSEAEREIYTAHLALFEAGETVASARASNAASASPTPDAEE